MDRKTKLKIAIGILIGLIGFIFLYQNSRAEGVANYVWNSGDNGTPYTVEGNGYGNFNYFAPFNLFDDLDWYLQYYGIKSAQTGCPALAIYESDTLVSETNPASWGTQILSTLDTNGPDNCDSNPIPTYADGIWTWNFTPEGEYLVGSGLPTFQPYKYYTFLIQNNYGEDDFQVITMNADLTGTEPGAQNEYGTWINAGTYPFWSKGKLVREFIAEEEPPVPPDYQTWLDNWNCNGNIFCEGIKIILYPEESAWGFWRDTMALMDEKAPFAWFSQVEDFATIFELEGEPETPNLEITWNEITIKVLDLTEAEEMVGENGKSAIKLLGQVMLIGLFVFWILQLPKKITGM